MLNEKITFDKFIRWAIITLLVVTVLVAVNYLSEVLLPFFVAWLLAYLVYPRRHVCGRHQRRDRRVYV